jgi:hypothetical protein
MGYYVTLTESSVMIPGYNKSRAYTALCALNERNDLKRGGVMYGDSDKNKRPLRGAHKDVWFSWMDWNYPETCADVEAILKALGFDFYNDGADIIIHGYDDKTGAEQDFLNALAPYITPLVPNQKAVMVWRGEDGRIWRNLFANGEMVSEVGRLVFDSDLISADS